LEFVFLDSPGNLPYYDRGNWVAIFYLMTMPISVVIVDYGAGNLRSVVNALRILDCTPLLSSSPEDISRADAVVLPGVGAAGAAMKELGLRGLIEPIKRHVSSGKPLLGVCLGLQLLLTDTEEGGLAPCMGLLPGRVKKLSGSVKIPHMGWNQVKLQFLFRAQLLCRACRRISCFGHNGLRAHLLQRFDEREPGRYSIPSREERRIRTKALF
jgi:hypothetical protein